MVDLLRLMVPRRMVVVMMASGDGPAPVGGGEGDSEQEAATAPATAASSPCLVEPWFGTEYQVRPLSPSQLAAWDDAYAGTEGDTAGGSKDDTGGGVAPFRFPPPNPYIPTDFTLRHPEAAKRQRAVAEGKDPGKSPPRTPPMLLARMREGGGQAGGGQATGELEGVELRGGKQPGGKQRAGDRRAGRPRGGAAAPVAALTAAAPHAISVSSTAEAISGSAGPELAQSGFIFLCADAGRWAAPKAVVCLEVECVREDRGAEGSLAATIAAKVRERASALGGEELVHSHPYLSARRPNLRHRAPGCSSARLLTPSHPCPNPHASPSGLRTSSR